MFGTTHVRQYAKIYDNTQYMGPYTGGTFEVHKNYVQATLQDSYTLQLSFNGYAQTTVHNQYSEGLELGLEDIINLGWSSSGSSGGDLYYRKPFNGSHTFDA